jgi:glycosyltransferase involved in cell wall biosynthesis
MSDAGKRVLIGLYFYPRGGSALACRAIGRELEANGFEVLLVAGSRSDLGEVASAERFFAGLELHAVDFTPAIRSSGDPIRYSGPLGTAPMHGSYEDRAGADDPVLARLDRAAFELQVEAWAAVMREAAARVDVLYLNHLTPLNEAAARVVPELPVIGHVHGTELLMLEQIEQGPPPGWQCAADWAKRMRRWAAACDRIVVNDPGGLERAAGILGLEESRFTFVPNGFGPEFSPGLVDRRAHWRRHLVEQPRGWRPGGAPGGVGYEERDLDALEGVVLVSVGRFTEVKSLPLLIEAFADARDAMRRQTALVLVGGHPGEWEGEHPHDALARTGARDVFLAGWHPHEELPAFFRAGDALVHASVREQFGQVLVEAMACGLPVIAVDRGGPSTIVEDPGTGWLIEPNDGDALAAAIVAAVEDEEGRRSRGKRARRAVLRRYSWSEIGRELASLVDAVSAGRR